MAIMTGRRAMMEMLKAEGVRYIFGNPGTSEAPIMDELESHPELHYMLVLQEGVAMGMADAYARATRQPAFVSLHIQTGLANGISLLYNAREGGTPMVLSAANKDIRELAQGRTDVAEMARQFTKWSAEVTHPEQVPAALRRAFTEARTPPTGPAFVGFAANALDEEADVDIMASGESYSRLAPDKRAIEDAAALLAAATNPLLVVGDRVGQSSASAEAVRVAELLGARVYASFSSEMNFPMSHPQFDSGVMLGFKSTRQLLSKGDVVLMVGKLSTQSHLFSDAIQLFMDPGTKLIHMDVDPTEVGKSQPTDVGIIADPKVGLAELAEALEGSMSGSLKETVKGRAATLAAEKDVARAAWEQQVRERWDHRPMFDDRMAAEIAEVLPEDVTILRDASTSGTALAQVFQFDKPDRLFGMQGGAIGWGLGGGMGLKLAQPDTPVVAFVGDGSAMMTIQALWTAAVEKVPVVYVICNNGSYKVVRMGVDNYRRQILNEESPRTTHLGSEFPIPLDIAGIARDMGVYGQRIEDPAELKPAMRHALELGAPAVLDVIIDGSA